MSPGLIYLLLIGSMAILVVGVVQAHRGYEQQAEAVRRGRQDRGEPARRRLRYTADLRLRRTALGHGVEERLATAGIEVATLDFLAIVLTVTLAAYVLTRLLVGPGVAVLVAIAAVFGCYRYVAYRRARRTAEFVAQLPELARVMSNASSAGLAMPRAIEIASAELGKPASEIMQRVIEELRLGQTVERALAHLGGRMPSREVSVLVSTLVIQQRAGGDTIAALRGMADTLEARKDLRREVKTVMAGAVASGWAVFGIGAGALVLINVISPGVLEDMTRNNIGRLALVVGLGLFTLGFLLTRRITRIET